MEIWLDESYGKLEYDKERNFLKLTLIGNIAEEDYKNIWNVSLEEAQKVNCGNVLVDQQKIGYVKMMSRAWLMLKWMPESKKKMGEVEQKLAILPSKHAAHRTGLHYLLDALKKVVGHGFELFETEEQAILWLSSTKKEQELENEV